MDERRAALDGQTPYADASLQETQASSENQER